MSSIIPRLLSLYVARRMLLICSSASRSFLFASVRASKLLQARTMKAALAALPCS